MDPIKVYCERLHLHDAHCSRIDHNDAMVAVVYKIVRKNAAPLILKVCSRTHDFLREAHFLSYFSGKLPVPRVLQLVEPESTLSGAILMECLSGELLKSADLTEKLAFEIGSLLAQIHANPAPGYGDLVQPQSLSPNPFIPFSQKFEEGLEECTGHLPAALIDNCRHYLHTHADVLKTVDGPCIVHRDFRAGNVIVADGKVQGIIDWSSARGGFAEQDLATLEQGKWPLSAKTKQAFLAGYASVRPVPDYSNMLPLLNLAQAVGIIGFMVKRNIYNGGHAALYQANRRFLEQFF